MEHLFGNDAIYVELQAGDCEVEVFVAYVALGKILQSVQGRKLAFIT